MRLRRTFFFFFCLASLLWGAPAKAQNWPLELSRLKKDLKNPNKEIRFRAVDAISQRYEPEVLSLLKEATRDKSEDVACLALQRLGDRVQTLTGEAFSEVVKVLTEALTHASEDVRIAAVEALGAAGSGKQGAPPEDVWESLVRVLSDSSAKVRREAIQALALTGSKEALFPLVEKLKDTSVEVREMAAKKLGELGEPGAVLPLTHALFDSDSTVRLAVAGALGRLKATQAVPVLITCLRDPNENLVQEVILALGMLKDKRAVDPLLELLYLYDQEQFQDTSFRNKIAFSLGEIGDPLAAEPLAEALRSPSDRAIIEALEKLGSASIKPVSALLKQQIDRSRYDPLGAAAVEVLGLLEGEEVTKILLEELSLPSHPKYRIQVIKALGKQNDPQAISSLLLSLKDPEASVRLAVLDALPEKIPVTALNSLIEALSDKRSDVRQKAISLFERIEPKEQAKEAVAALLALINRAEEDRLTTAARTDALEAIKVLGRFPDQRAEKALLEVLGSDFALFRRAAGDVLAESPNPNVKEALLAIAADKKHPGRAYALRALYGIAKSTGEKELISKASAFLNDPDFEVSYAAARVLSLARGRETSPRLLAFLAHPDERKTLLMLSILPHVSPEDAVLPLLSGLRSPKPLIRIASAWGLGVTGDPRALEPLLTALKEGIQNEDFARREPGLVALNAAAALGLLGDPAAAPTLETCLGSSDELLRANCVLALARVGGDLSPIAQVAEKDGHPLVRSVAMRALLLQSRDKPEARAILERIASSATGDDAKLARLFLDNKIPQLPFGEGYVEIHKSSPPQEKRKGLYLAQTLDGTIKVGVFDEFGDRIEPGLLPLGIKFENLPIAEEAL